MSDRLPRGSLTREAIVTTALGLLDRGEELSMRTLAAQLRTKPMSLYNHIDGRDDLVDAVLARILGEVHLPALRGKQWREFLRQAAAEHRTVLLRHAGAVPVVLRRPMTPAAHGSWERLVAPALAAYQAAGLSDQDAVFALRGLHALVVGLVLNEVTAVSPVAPTGIPATAAAEFATPDFDATFTFAVNVFINGLGR